MTTASACGIFECSNCKHYCRQLCPGCLKGNQLLLTRGEAACAVYNCATSQDVDGCERCCQATCRVYEEPEDAHPLRGQFESRRWWLGKLAAHFDRKWDKAWEVPSAASGRTVDRMRLYLHTLDELAGKGVPAVSSWQIARKVGVTSGLIRKDLSYFGGFGKRGVGYDVGFLRGKIIEILGLDQVKHIAWIGARRLLQEPGQLERLANHNCRVVAVFDKDPDKLGTRIGDLQVMEASSMRHVVKNLCVDAAVIACSDEDAQWAADQFVSAGVKALLNLTHTVVVTPGHVFVRNLDLASEMFALSYYCHILGGRNETDARVVRNSEGSDNRAG